MSEIMTEAVKQDFENNYYLNIVCKKCDFELGYFHNLHNYKEIMKAVKLHLVSAHNLPRSDL
jgi:transcription initiation factor IIE alpha subunit